MSPRLQVIRVTMADNTSYFPANGVYSMSNKCSNSAVWAEWDAKLRIALFALFLVVFIIILIQWLIIRARSVKAKQILFGSFGTATVLMIVYLIIAIAADTLYDCLRISSFGYTNFFVAVNVLQSLANFLLLFIMLIPLTLTLLRHNCFKVDIPKVLNSFFLAILFVICILNVAMLSSDSIDVQETGDHGMFASSIVPIAATYSVLYLVGALVAVGYVVASLKTMLKYPTEFNGLLKWTMPALAASVLSFAAVDFVEVIGWDVANANWTTTTEVTFLILNLFTQAATYELLLIVAGDKSFMDDDDRTGQGVLGKEGASLAAHPQNEHPQIFEYA